MLDQRNYSGLLKKTLIIFFVIFFPLGPKLKYSDEKMLVQNITDKLPNIKPKPKYFFRKALTIDEHKLQISDRMRLFLCDYGIFSR